MSWKDSLSIVMKVFIKTLMTNVGTPSAVVFVLLMVGVRTEAARAVFTEPAIKHIGNCGAWLPVILVLYSAVSAAHLAAKRIEKDSYSHSYESRKEAHRAFYLLHSPSAFHRFC